MKNILNIGWLRNVSIAKKLYFAVGIMALLIATELFTLWFALSTLSSIRAYVGGEGLWSKAQKDAFYQLQKYARTHDEADYQSFLEFMKVPFGDRKTRFELAKKYPDWSAAREGFLEGRNHPSDIDGMIKLFMRFHKIYYINKAITIWAETDPLIMQLLSISEKLHNEISTANPSQENINNLLQQIDPINQKLTLLEDDFSFTLGEGSRWLENIILKLLLAVALTVEISGLLLTISVSRGIAKGLKEIIRASNLVAKGDFNTRALAYSNDEIGVLARSFNSMTDELKQNISKRIQAEEASRAKQEFLSIMSHEIRTPLNAVLGITQMLIEENPGREQLEQLNILKFSAGNLMSLLSNILDFSKIESGKIQFEQINFNIKILAKEVTDSFSANAREKGLTLKLFLDNDIPEMLTGDPLRLTQILNNLVNNAIKFTQKGTVALRLEVVSGDDKKVKLLFEVKDSGVGINKDKHQEIFESFAQAHTYISREYGGTGLGLTICKRLVELLGGQIHLESEEGKGSVFSFRLEFLKSVHPGIKKINRNLLPAKDSLNGIKILLVEDNPTNQALTQKILSRWGGVVDCADNGKIAVDKVKINDYDLVLMDLQMPVMDGYAANRAIRDMGYNYFKLPIVALTAFASAEDKLQVFEEGMNDFVAKPIDTNELYQKIVKNVKHPPLEGDGSDDNSDTHKETANLKELIDSYKDDPEFVRKYIRSFRNEFIHLHQNILKFVSERDVKELSQLVHKITPSIHRLTNHALSIQLNRLKELLSNNNSKAEDITNATDQIKIMANEALDYINSAEQEFL